MTTVDVSDTSYNTRYNLREYEDPEAWEYYMDQLAQRWDPEEIVLASDKDQFNSLEDRYKTLVKDLVAFFAPGDGIVCEQIDHLKAESKVFAQRAFLGEQFSIEVVHARAYKAIIETFFPNREAEEIYQMVDTLPCVKEKADFVTHYMEAKTLPLGVRYVSAAVSEGVFFVSLFAIIFYLKKKGLLSNFCFLNEQVAKDEKLHRDYDMMMAKRLLTPEDYPLVEKIVRDGIEIETRHIEYILRDSIDTPELDGLGGITVDNMKRYIAKLGDDIMIGCGLPRTFTYPSNRPPVEGRLEEYSPAWMSVASMSRKTNFYEGIVGNYATISKKGTGDIDQSMTGDFDFD